MCCLCTHWSVVQLPAVNPVNKPSPSPTIPLPLPEAINCKSYTQPLDHIFKRLSSVISCLLLLGSLAQKPSVSFSVMSLQLSIPLQKMPPCLLEKMQSAAAWIRNLTWFPEATQIVGINKASRGNTDHGSLSRRSNPDNEPFFSE